MCIQFVQHKKDISQYVFFFLNNWSLFPLIHDTDYMTYSFDLLRCVPQTFSVLFIVIQLGQKNVFNQHMQ